MPLPDIGDGLRLQGVADKEQGCKECNVLCIVFEQRRPEQRGLNSERDEDVEEKGCRDVDREVYEVEADDVQAVEFIVQCKGEIANVSPLEGGISKVSFVKFCL
jgi:hypothetical protein